MNKTLIALATAFALAAVPATATEPLPDITYTGAFAVGEPIGALAYDACGEPAFEGVNSNCVALTGDHVGQTVALTATSGLGTSLEVGACFYGADGYIECGDVVPAGATDMAIYGLGDISYEWSAVIPQNQPSS